VNEYINNAGEKLFAWFCGVIFYNIIGVILFHSDKLFRFVNDEYLIVLMVLKHRKLKNRIIIKYHK